MKGNRGIRAAVLAGGLLMGGMCAFSSYATNVEIEDAKKQVYRNCQRNCHVWRHRLRLRSQR